MEWVLRIILLAAGAVIIAAIFWAYRRHKDEQELDLNRAARMDEDPQPDPIDLDVGKPRVVPNPNAQEHSTDQPEPRIDDQPDQTRPPEAQPLADDPTLRAQPEQEEQDQWVDGPPTESHGRNVSKKLKQWLKREQTDNHEISYHNSEPGDDELSQDASPDTNRPPQATTAARMAAERARTAEADSKTQTPLKQGFNKHFTRKAQPTAAADTSAEQATTDPEVVQQPATGEPQPTASTTAPETESTQTTASEPAATEQAQPKADEQVISLFVVEKQQQPMPGVQVQKIIEELGFEFGFKSLYHFHDLAGNTWLSLMNAVDPGTFDPQDSDSFNTPALALFMRVPGSTGNPDIVFDRMLSIANEIAESLDAVVLDEQKRLLDSEAIDRYRHLIAEHS